MANQVNQTSIPGTGGFSAPKITLEMVRESKTFECECGGKLFGEQMFFKKLSPLITPTGKEELYPMMVVVCKDCGKVPNAFNKENMVPEELLATKSLNLSMGAEFPLGKSFGIDTKERITE